MGIEELEDKIAYLENIIEEKDSTINELEEYIVELERKQEGLHDIDNFKRVLEINRLMTKELDDFIDNYMRWSNG